MDCGTPGFSVLHHFPELAQTHVHWVADAIQPSHPLSLPSPPTLNLSQHQGLFQWFSSSHQVARLLELQLHHQSLPMTIQGWFPLGLTGLISLLSKGLSRVLSSSTYLKQSVLQRSAFFRVQLSHPYLTTGKTIALTSQTFVSKVMSLHFNMLSRFVITFLPRSKHLLISWLQSPSAVILEPKKMKSLTVSIVSPSVCHEVMGLDAMILAFWMLSFKPTFSLSSFTFNYYTTTNSNFNYYSFTTITTLLLRVEYQEN